MGTAEGLDQGWLLSVLSGSDGAELQGFVRSLWPELERLGLEVMENRLGLVMASGLDSSQGVAFHLGEVLVSEARVRLGDAQGYGLCLGDDLERALHMAVLDAAYQRGLFLEEIRRFVTTQAAKLREADELMLRKAAATRVDMENF